MILTSNNFYWLTNLKAKLLLKFHEYPIRNLDLRIIWIRDKGSFGVSNIQISACLYETRNIYCLCPYKCLCKIWDRSIAQLCSTLYGSWIIWDPIDPYILKQMLLSLDWITQNFIQLLQRLRSCSVLIWKGLQLLNLDHLDPTNKNTFRPISQTVKKVLTPNYFYWLTSLNIKLLLTFHEDRVRNLDLRITWIQDKGSFGVGNTN